MIMVMIVVTMAWQLIETLVVGREKRVAASRVIQQVKELLVLSKVHELGKLVKRRGRRGARRPRRSRGSGRPGRSRVSRALVVMLMVKRFVQDLENGLIAFVDDRRTEGMEAVSDRTLQCIVRERLTEEGA